MACICNNSGYCATCFGEGCDVCDWTGECLDHQAWQLPRQRHFQERLRSLSKSAPSRDSVRSKRLVVPSHADACFSGRVRIRNNDLDLSIEDQEWEIEIEGSSWKLPASHSLNLQLTEREANGIVVRLVVVWDPLLRDGEGGHRWRVENDRSPGQ
jgi:hypothetical protein